MSKHMVFLVHGMGDAQPGWSSSVWKQLAEQYAGLEHDHLWPWDQSFSCHEILYNDCFDTVRQQWLDDMPAALAVLEAAGVNKTTRDKLQKLSDAQGAQQFLQTHVLDVILYRFVELVRDAVRARVGLQITSALLSVPSGTPWSLIAHSLGTSVAHDTLHALYLPRENGIPGVKPAHLVTMLANVSRTLQTDSKPYESLVHPGPGGEGVTNHFLNVRHRLDPVPACWPFQPADDWPTTELRATGRFVHLDLSAITEPNVHAFEHYLRDPACYVELFRKLTIPELITDDEERSLFGDFLAKHQLADRILKKRRKELEQLQPEPATPWHKILEVFHAMSL